MITQIHIKNFAIVDELSIDLKAGFTVLTGETGAGKSLWIDAAALVLGERADASVIREGADRCEISLCFDITQIQSAQDWLKAQDLDHHSNECILRRVIGREGRSKSSINGRPCPQNLMRELSELLVSIHGQHQHQTLLNSEQQQFLLDQYGHHQTLVQQCQEKTLAWQQIEKKIEQLSKQNDRQTQLDFLNYQLEELTALQLQPEELEKLTLQHKKLHHAKELLTELDFALNLLNGEHNSTALQIHRTKQALEKIKKYEPAIISFIEILDNIHIQTEDIANELQVLLSTYDNNEEDLTVIEQRLEKIHDIARKHHCQPEDLMEKQKTLEKTRNELQTIDSQLEKLTKEKAVIFSEYLTIAQTLSKSRYTCAKKLEQLITEKMHVLGMNHGQFIVQFTAQSEEKPSAQGLEKIQFMVSTNPGNPLQALQKVVSGGELSRISLAIQLLTAQKDNIPTLIFDEVDVGIGGKTAAVVGELLRRLGTLCQVLCITHQPQVAAFGHQHYQVIKKIGKNSTQTLVKNLTQSERVQELARMVGGVDITEEALKHAEKLLVVSS